MLRVAVHRPVLLRLTWTACCNTDGWDPPRVSDSVLPGWGLRTGISSKFPGNAAAAGQDRTESHWLRLSLEGILGNSQQSLHRTNQGAGTGRHTPVAIYPFRVMLSVVSAVCVTSVHVVYPDVDVPNTREEGCHFVVP